LPGNAFAAASLSRVPISVCAVSSAAKMGELNAIRMNPLRSRWRILLVFIFLLEFEVVS
jgi:hypothetical protein